MALPTAIANYTLAVKLASSAGQVNTYFCEKLCTCLGNYNCLYNKTLKIQVCWKKALMGKHINKRQICVRNQLTFAKVKSFQQFCASIAASALSSDGSRFSNYNSLENEYFMFNSSSLR